MSNERSPREVCLITIGISGLMRAPRRRLLPPSEARLRRRLTPLAAGCCAGVAWPYQLYCPARRRLASLARSVRGTRLLFQLTHASHGLLASGGPQLRIAGRLLLLGRPQLLTRARQIDGDRPHVGDDLIKRLSQAEILAQAAGEVRFEHLPDRVLRLVLCTQDTLRQILEPDSAGSLPQELRL